jgi:predicted metal-dependent phosphoesterase TrpH
MLGRLGRIATLGRRRFSITPETFDDYMADVEKEGIRAKRLYGLVLVPGVEVTQNHIRARHNAHIIALGVKEFISADLKAKEILEEIRSQDALSIACHPHHRTTTRLEIGTCYLWDKRKELADLVDVWEAANRDDLFSVTSLKHYPYVANSDFHKAKHLYSWKTLVRSAKTWPAVKAALTANTDVSITLFRKAPC